MAEPKGINFPNGIPPTTRSYTPGRYPSKKFESLNGSVVNIRYGRMVVDAKLSMTFENITYAEGNQIIENYYKVNSNWNYVDFGNFTGLQALGSEGALKLEIRQRDSVSDPPKLRWRYQEPPTLTERHTGLCSVSCKFRGFLDG